MAGGVGCLSNDPALYKSAWYLDAPVEIPASGWKEIAVKAWNEGVGTALLAGAVGLSILMRKP